MKSFAEVNLDAARYGKHSIYNVLVKAKREGRLTDELRKQIINTKKYL